jgi:hypothetical protein
MVKMNSKDVEEFSEIWTAAFVMYGKEATPMVIVLAYEALKEFEIKDISRALSSHVKDPDHGKYLVKPSDIVRILTGSKSSAAMAAWSKVYKAIIKTGGYRSVVFDDPIIHKVIDEMSSWPKICEILEKDVPFVAKDFERRYLAHINDPDLKYPKLLKGICDTVNQDISQEEIVFIGDAEKAKAIYDIGDKEPAIQIGG